MKLRSFLMVFAALALVTCAPEPVVVTHITLNPQSITLDHIGQTEQLTATISPSNADNQTILWSSSNADVVTVDKNGLVTAKAKGDAVITALSDDGNKSAACAVSVLISVTGVSLDKTSISLLEGGIDNLKATVAPDDADNPSLLWSSSNPDVVLITGDGANGKLFAMAPGTADITVTTVDGGYTATCKITVQEVKMELKPQTLDILVGQTQKIEVILGEQNQDVSHNIYWYSTDENIVTVDGDGLVKALTAGDAIVYATTDRGKTAFCKVHVRNKLESVTVTATPQEKEIIIGGTLQLKAVISPDLPGIEKVWESSDTSIATVDANGLVTAKTIGAVTITVTVTNGPETKTATYEIEVIQPVTSISVSPATLTMYVGDELVIDDTFTVEIGPKDATNRSVHFGFSRTGIVKTDNGKLIGLKAGDVVLFFYPNKTNSPSLRAECEITVKAKVEKVTLPTAKTIQVKETLQLKATVTPSNADQEVTWSSSKPEVATVSENGLVTGVTAGTTVITATSKDDPSIKATCTVTVMNIPVESVTLNKTSLTLVEGSTATLTAAVKPENAFDRTPTWSSSNSEVATVSDKGVVTAVKAGTATITAKCGEKSASCEVTVTPQHVDVTGVTLDKTDLSMVVGDTQTLTATVAPANASNQSVTWSSDNTSVATVNNSGIVTAKSAGNATITVTTIDGGKTATCQVTVAPAVASITLSQTTATLAYGQTLKLTATVLPADAADPSITWTSSNSKVASVSDGTVTAGSTAGTATITAKSTSNPKVSATCTVTVKSKIVNVNGVSLNYVNLNLYVGQSKKLTATVTPSNADNKEVIWSVAQGGVVRVDQNGTVTGLRAGQSTVFVKTVDGGYQKTCSVTVTRNEVDHVELDKTSLVLKVGETYDLKATVVGVDTSVSPSNSNVKWTCTPTGIVSVDKGRITALKSGTATVKVTSSDNSGKYAECAVKVITGSPGSGGTEGIDFDDWNF